ncbi:MAG: hypothetical protein MZU91_05920 [Desulfosudis oleivorans]|nr:hypothetical protein [Desulfosudis oleivorans]
MGWINIKQYETIEQLKQDFPKNKFYYFTTKANINYADISYNSGDFLVFGSETRGLPKDLIAPKP